MILYGLIIVIHVIASLVLILVILLQAGRGGGLNEAFGGGQSQTIFGTSAPTFLTRATTASAIIFLSSCLILAVMSSRKSHSVMEKEALKSSLMEPLQEKPKTLPAGSEAKPGKSNGALPATVTPDAASSVKVAPKAAEKAATAPEAAPATQNVVPKTSKE